MARIRKPKFQIPKGKYVACDSETTGLHHWGGDNPFAWSFCSDQGETAYIEWPVDPRTRKVIPDPIELYKFTKWWTDPDTIKVFWNADFDVRMGEVGLELPPIQGQIEDAQIAFHCFRSVEQDYKLKRIARRWAKMPDDDEKKLAKAAQQARKEARKINKNAGEELYWLKYNVTATDYWLVKPLLKKNYCEEYAVKDAIRTMKLWLLLLRQFQKNDPVLQQRWLNYEFEMRELFQVIYNVEGRGLRFHPEYNDELKLMCDDIKEKEYETLCEIAGENFNHWQTQPRQRDEPFNPGSDPQLRRFIYHSDYLNLEPDPSFKLKVPKLTKAQKKLPPLEQQELFDEKLQINYSTSNDALQNYRNDPTIQTLFRWKKADKAKGTYFEAFERFAVDDHIIPDIRVVHPNIRQGGKATGRFSVGDPNLQGVSDSDSSKGIVANLPGRKPFGPRPGYNWFTIDYSGLEIRTFAMASRYQLLIDILAQDRDLHTETTEAIWGGVDNARGITAACNALGINPNHKPDRIEASRQLADFDWQIVPFEKSINDNKTSRGRGKQFFFLRMFGGGGRLMSEKFEVSLSEGRDFCKQYDRKLPGVVGFLRSAEKAGRRNMWVQTEFGRVLDLEPDFTYKACSYRVQGTAADLVKRAMVACEEFLNSIPEVVKAGGILLQIHDELIFELPEDVPDWVVNMLCLLMSNVCENIESAKGIKFPVSVGIITDNWSEPVKWSDWKKGKRRGEKKTAKTQKA